MFADANDLRLDPVQRLQYVDCQTMLLDNLLMKADKISMAHSLEVRVPFLIAPAGRVRAGAAAPREDRPACVTNAWSGACWGRSWGRGSPTGRSAGSRSRSIDGFVSRPPSRSASDSRPARWSSTLGFDPRALGALVDRHLGGEDVGRKLFALTALEQWIQKFG